MVRLFVGLLLVPALWACSPAKPVSSNIIEQNPRLEMALNMKYATLSCADRAKCPENVGYILANIGKNGLSQCTGWLVAPDVIATNSHCIPEEMKTDAAKCIGNMSIKFPATNGMAEEVLDCAGVLFFSKIVDKQGDEGFIKKADYAFFRVTKPSQRRVFKMTRSGMADGQDLTVFSVDPQSEAAPIGKIFKRTCRPTKNTLLMPEDTSALSEVAVVFGDECTARHGNSGSPVINNLGEVAGWLHGGIMEETDPTTLFPDKTILEGGLKRAAMFTNAACIPAFAAVPSLGVPGANCAGEARKAFEQTEAMNYNIKLSKEIVNGISVVYGGWLPKATNVFKFRSTAIVPAINDRVATLNVEPVVECILPVWGASTNESSYAHLPAKDAMPASLLVRLAKPSVKVEMKIDALWRIKFAVSAQAGVPMNISVDPSTVRACTQEEINANLPLNVSFAAN